MYEFFDEVDVIEKFLKLWTIISDKKVTEILRITTQSQRLHDRRE